MALLRKKSRSPGRRRPAAAAPPSAKAFSYGGGSRPETAQNTGRQPGRGRKDSKKPSPSRPTNISLKRFWAQRVGMIILIAVIAICLVKVLSLSTHAKLLPLESADKHSFLRDEATYQAAADKLLAGSIWNRNKITIDTSSFDKQMTKQFPELSGVSVAVPLLAHRPVVYIQSAQPALILATSNGSFVIDDRGKALLAADGSDAQNKLPQVIDQSGLQVKLNQQVLTPDDVRFIQTIVRQLAARQVTVSSLVLPAGTSELDARIAGQTYFVKFNLHDDNPRQQAGTFLATINQLNRKHTPPAQYVDVRVPGRAYYQ